MTADNTTPNQTGKDSTLSTPEAAPEADVDAGGCVLVLTAYERDNLRAALLAASGFYGASPLTVLHNGDWLMQVGFKIDRYGPNGTVGRPNETPEELVARCLHTEVFLSSERLTDSIVIPRSSLPPIVKDDEGYDSVDVKGIDSIAFVGKLRSMRQRTFNRDPDNEYLKALAHLAFAEYYASGPDDSALDDEEQPQSPPPGVDKPSVSGVVEVQR